MPTNDERGLVLRGLDGGNPLGFLAAVGTLRILADESGDAVRLGWKSTKYGWRPILVGCGVSEDELCDVLLGSFKRTSDYIFDIGKERKGNKEHNKFPFDAARFAQALQESARSGQERRDADFLASFGTDIYPDSKTGEFRCTSFKMVRSGDSKGQGMLCYAKDIRVKIGRSDIKRTLFQTWDYGDEGYSLRWDPIDDRRYALRWRNPSESKPGTMNGANGLAIDALRCLPAVNVGTQMLTTGFHQIKGHKLFVWPIWTPPVGVDAVRSLLSLRDLYATPERRVTLAARGIEEIYGVRLVRPNQYYYNFAPAQPVE